MPADAFIENIHIQFPILGAIRAGEPIFAEGNIIGYLNAPKFAISSGEYFYLIVKGDSMDLEGITEGSYVLVRQQEDVENNEIAIVLINGDEATIKRVYKSENTITLIPKSSNPIHQPSIIDCKKVPVKIVGKVVGQWRDMR